MSTRLERLKELQTTVKEYAIDERRRIDKEVVSLKKILEGRAAQATSVDRVTKVAQQSLAEFLR